MFGSARSWTETSARNLRGALPIGARRPAGCAPVGFPAKTFLFTVAAQRNQSLCDLTWFDKPYFEPVHDVVPAETIRAAFRESLSAPLATSQRAGGAGHELDDDAG